MRYLSHLCYLRVAGRPATRESRRVLRRRRKDIGTTAQVLGGRIGAYRKWARCTDRAAAVAASHASFNARFEREIDPEGVLPELERAQRAQAARSAHFAAMALKRHQTHLKNKGRK